MAPVEVRHEKANASHVASLVAVMRPEDAELARGFGFEPEEALGRAVAGSDIATATYFDGRLAAVWGASGNGSVWVYPTPFGRSRPRTLLLASRAALDVLGRNLSEALWAVVDINHEAAMRFAFHLGFKVDRFVGARLLRFTRSES